MNYLTRLGIRHLFVLVLVTSVVGAGCDLFRTDIIEVDGVVSRESGETVAGATVHLCASTLFSRGPSRLSTLESVTTGSHGEFSISISDDRCSEGTPYWLYVSVENYGARLDTKCRSHSSVQLQMYALSPYEHFVWCPFLADAGVAAAPPRAYRLGE